MAISDTIQSMYENVGEVYDTITNVNLPTNKNIANIPRTIKDSYLEIMNNGIDVVWDNWEKVMASGTSLTLTPTEEAPMKIIPKGNTSQVQYSGKNKFGVSDNTRTFHGITITTTNNKVSFSGTPDQDYVYTSNQTFNLPAGTYTCSSTNTSKDFFIWLKDSNNNTIGTFNLNGGTKTVTTSVDAVAVQYGIEHLTINTAINVETYFQIESGSTPTPYEPYCGGTPSPNPSYPQDIHSVSGDNEIEVCGKNLFDFERYKTDNPGATVTGTEDNFYTHYFGNYSYIYLNCKENTTYTISYDWSTNVGNGAMRCYYTDGTNTQMAWNYSNAPANGSVNFTSDSNKTIEKIGFIDYRNDSGWTIQNLQVELGSSKTTYEPYTGNIYPLYLGVENFFDKDNANVLNNTYIGSSSLGTSTGASTLYISCKPNTTYTISRIAGKRFVIGDTSTTPTSGVSISNRVENHTATNLTTTTSQNAQYLCVFYYLSSQDTLTEQEIRDSIQIVYGSTPQHTSTQPITLNKIGNYQDKIVKTDKWYWYRERGTIIFDGTEGWTFENRTTTPSNRTVISKYNIINASTSDKSYLSNMFIYNSSSSNRLLIANNGIQVYISLDDEITGVTSADTNNEARDKCINYITNHNVELNYVLPTPTYTEITDTTLLQQLEAIYNAKSKEVTTNISQVNYDLPFELDVTALKKTN